MTATPWTLPRLLNTPTVAVLTPRQADVLAGICWGHTNQQIGARLGLSVETVKTHAKGLYRAMNANDRAHAAALAASGQLTVVVRDGVTDWSVQ